MTVFLFKSVSVIMMYRNIKSALILFFGIKDVGVDKKFFVN